MKHPRPSLTELLDFKTRINVVDIGANPHGGSALPPYQGMLERGLVHLVGFEPNPEALALLEAEKSVDETYLPHAVFDGSVQTLNLCHASGMTSLFEPNEAVLNGFHGFSEWGKVIGREEIETVRLDDVSEIEELDFLKIDIQGAELEVFRNGTEKLAGCLVIQTEVEFLEMYRGQPLFADVDQFLRGLGFMLHRFEDLTSRAVKPLVVNNDPYAGVGQVLWADAIYIRDFTRFAELGAGKLLKLALILHDVYGSFDLALRALLVRDAMLGTDLGKLYLEKLSNG
ncbi:FkbM family methyltransferase [Nisaea acidiphila]|uniref:FkbM family methyltransferase n=1 Tax=Nisaea acidiphila TaxID=1862145 RepID=A0A9J7AQ46_9PROT|nr:FkbM family methyltransferase [Nisaea acidiphila]UUX49520.1 FkbM family methyltransferase [Nisaea acidiphila]